MSNGKGKGHNKPPVATVAVVLQEDVDGDGQISHGDKVTFNVQSSEQWSQVNCECSQNGVPVYGGNFPITNPLTLESSAWPSGAATCHAKVIDIASNVLGETDFDVAE